MLKTRVLTILLIATSLLCAEEYLHFFRSHPNEVDWQRTSLHHPGCTDVRPNGLLIQCPVKGYGSALFVCMQQGCTVQDDANGTYISPAQLEILSRAR